MPRTLSRREFLKLSASATLSAAALAGLKNAAAVSAGETPAGLLTSSTEDKIVPGVCLLCPSGCGTLARVADGRVVKLEGNPMHPVNQGALCPKGQAAPELLYNPDRLTGPLQRTGERGSGRWQPITWDAAVRQVAQHLRTLRGSGRPERFVVMHGEARGQLRPLFEQFMQRFGSPNLVGYESLNVAAAKLGLYLTQGIYDLPAYDLENSAYVLSFGANLLEAGPFPQRMISGYAYLRRGRAQRAKVVVIDPRQGITGSKADEWIPINPGTDAALALGMAHVIIRSGLIDINFIQNYSFGYNDFPDESGQILHQGFKSFVLEHYSPQQVEAITGVPSTTIARLAGEFAGQKPSVAVLPGKGGLLNGSIGGVYAAMAIHCLNALVGAIDTPGGVLTQRYFPAPPWPAGQPDSIAERGCQAERVDGAGSLYPLAFQSYQAVAERVLAGYPVEVLFLAGANPVYECPGGASFIAAFEQIPLVVSFASFMDESAQYADLVLPAPTFLEHFEDHPFEGLGYPGVGLRQPALEPLFNTLSTGDFFLKLAAELGEPLASAFPWESYQEYLRDRLSLVGTGWQNLQDLGVWMQPGYRYAIRGSQTWVSEVVGRDRRIAPRDGYFDFYSRELSCLLSGLEASQLNTLQITQTGDAAFLPHYEPTPFHGDSQEYPFLLNVITLMSLGPFSPAANLPSLQEISGMTVGETWDSWVEMNPAAAERLNLHDHDQVVVESLYGSLSTRLRLVPGLHPQVVNLPANLGHTAGGRWASGRGVSGNALMSPASEPAAGLAAFTNTRVKIYRA